MFGTRKNTDRIASPASGLTMIPFYQPLMWFRVEVVNGEIEETLDPTGVQIHGDNVVAAGDELGRDGRAVVVCFVRPCIRMAGDHGGNAAGGSAFTCELEAPSGGR